MNSRASKHVDWCLNKAEKEIEESVKLGKNAKHRGLLKVEPSKELAIAHIDKAKHYLGAIQLLKKNNFSDLAVSCGFYSLYHCFLAIAIKFGYESKNQTCTISLIEFLQEEGKISVDRDIIEFMKYEEVHNQHEASLIELREDYTYGTNLEIKDDEQLDKIEKRCLSFIDAVREIVYS